MEREQQVKLIQSAEQRTTGYLREWLKNPKVQAVIRRQDRPHGDDGNGHYETRLRKRATA